MDTSADDPTTASADGVTVDPTETRQPLVIGVTVTVVLLATFATALRVHVRAVILKSWGADDSALVGSFVLVFLVGLLMLINTHYGDGVHAATLSRDNYLKTQEIAITAVAIYQAAYPLVKSTFLLQYRRVFPLPMFRKLCNIFLVFVIAFGIAQVVSICLACVPLRSLWDSSVPGKCIKLLDWWLVGSSINLFTDIVIYCMPLPLLQTLSLPTRQRIILLALFALGLFTCAISVIRITTLRQSSTSNDPTYNTVVAGIWSITELSCAIICACIPTLRPLLGRECIRSKIRNYLQEQTVDEGTETELFTQSDGRVMSQKRRTRILSTTTQHPLPDPEDNPLILVNSRNVSLSAVAAPPTVHLVKSRETLRENLMREMTMTLPLTRVETEDGVEFLEVEGAGQDPELPTPLQPPPRRHTDIGNRQSQGDYFSAVVWDASDQARLPEAPTSRLSMSPRNKDDGASPRASPRSDR